MTPQTEAPVVVDGSRGIVQPIVDARTHCIVGCELFAVRPQLAPPNQVSFNTIDLEVWVEAMMCLSACHQASSNLRLLASVTEQQLHSPIFIGQLKRTLDQHQIAASRIELKISERIVMRQPDCMIGCLTALRQYGFSIVLDKLGCGYSTFSRWLDIPLSGIRIDESLTRRAQSRGDSEIVEAIFKIASIRGLHTIGAGVHDAEAAAVLTLLGVQRLQGHHFGAAMDCQSFIQRLTIGGCVT
jgi:EAL domain-containing protein (putative c-di-GMP-specific phosphodiesterase class I)